MVIYGGVACFSRIQMVSLEKGLKEYHMQQDSLEVRSLHHRITAIDPVASGGAAPVQCLRQLRPLSVQYSSALEDVWMFDFVTRMWTEVNIIFMVQGVPSHHILLSPLCDHR